MISQEEFLEFNRCIKIVKECAKLLRCRDDQLIEQVEKLLADIEGLKKELMGM